jgi:hypothetical protein
LILAAKGDGPIAATLKVPPPDLTRISARHGGTFPLMRIEQIISGEEELSRGLCGGHHSAFADARKNLVWAEQRIWREGHFVLLV